MFTFLNTMLLSGLALLSVPFIIQYLIKRRKIVIYWGAWEWMKLAFLRRKKVTKLHNILKLLSKVLLLLAIIMLLSRPAILTQGGGNKLVIIDNSLSMGTVVSGGNRLEHAKNQVADLLRQSDGRVSIFSFDGEMKAIARPPQSQNVMESSVRNIELSPRSGSLNAFIENIKSIPDYERFDSIYFFSDFLDAQYKESETVLSAISALGKRHRVIFVPSDKRKNLKNAALLSCRPLPEGIYPGMRNFIHVEVMNFSPETMTSIPVTLSVNGKRQDRSVVSLGPGERTGIRLACDIPEKETARIEVEIPPDAFPYDNKLTAILNPGDALQVLAIRPDDPPKGRNFCYDFFFKAAMGSFLNMRYEAISPLRSLERNLDNYDLVVTFAAPFRDNTPFTENILGYLEKRRSLIAFADPSERDPWKLFGVSSSPEFTDKDLNPLPREDSYLSFMQEGLNPSLIHFYNFSTLSPSNNISGRLFIHGEANPVSAKIPFKNSTVILNGFLPYPSYTDFFYNPNFVQFCMRMVSDAIGAAEFQSVSGNEILELRIPAPRLDLDSQYTFEREGVGQESVKAVRQADSLLLSIPPMLDNMFCTITDREGGVYSFGYNVSRDGSNIEVAAKSSFAKAAEAGLRYQESSDFKEVKAVYEYAWLFIALLIIAAAFENYVHFWRRGAEYA